MAAFHGEKNLFDVFASDVPSAPKAETCVPVSQRKAHRPGRLHQFSILIR